MPYSVLSKRSALLAVLAYLAAALFGLSLAYEHSNASPIWPPSGVALVTLLLFGANSWWIVFSGAFLANLIVFQWNGTSDLVISAVASLFIALGNTLEALTGRYCIKKFVSPDCILDRYIYVFRFFLIILVSSVVSASLGTAALAMLSIIPTEALVVVWSTWLLGDIAGMLIIAPLLLQFYCPQAISYNRTNRKGYWGEYILNVLCVIFISLTIFSPIFSFLNFEDRIYLIIPFFMWNAYRFNNREVLITITVVAFIAVIGTIKGFGPFYSGNLNESLVALVSFISIISVSFMALRALLNEYERAANTLAESKAILEGDVVNRTEELVVINERLVKEIEDRKIVQYDLQKTKETLTEASGIAHLGHWDWDVVADKISWSDELYKIYGVNQETFDTSFVGYLSMLHPEDREMVQGKVNNAYVNHVFEEFSHRIVRPNGEVRWVRSNGRVVLNEKGELVKMMGTALDITELKEQESRYLYFTSIVENSWDAIIGEDLDKRITSWNKGAERIFGFKQADVIGKSIHVIIPHDRQGEEDAIIDKVKSGVLIEHYQTVRCKKNGELLSVSLTISPVRDVSGKIIGASKIARDVTRQKEIEDARFSLIVESAPNAMLLVNSVGLIEFINNQTEKLFGYSREELLQQPIEILLPERFRGHHPMFRAEFFDSPHARAMGAGRELFALHKSGEEIPVEIGLNPIHTDQGLMVLAAIIDISERKKIEEAKREKELAEESVKMKDQFLSNMSHEIRTPMNAIVGFTDLLEDTSLDVEQERYLKAIKHSGQNLLTVINDILDFSRIEAGKMAIEEVPMNISLLLSSMYELFKPKASEKHLDLYFHFDKEEEQEVLGDPVRLTQILTNLLGNAIKFTEKGKVELIVQTKDLGQNKLDYQFQIIDTGIGIPEDKIDSIFERFTQAMPDTTRKFGGTGLGLSIVKSLVKLQEGRINLTSKQGEGTMVSFVIPYMKSDQQQDLQSGSSGLMTNGVLLPGKLKVLLVEDNEMNQRLALVVLNKLGFEVDVADNGRIAIEHLEKTSYDVVLMDMQMPEMDGYEATAHIRKTMKNTIPIIAMTAHALSGEREKCLGYGMDEYISKPFRVEDLLNKIRTVIATRKRIAESHAVVPVVPTTEDHSTGRLTNLRYLKEVTMGDEAMMKEIIGMFGEQVLREMDALRQYIHTEERQAIKEIAHKMKSTVLMVGLQAVADQLLQLEKMAQGDTDSKTILENYQSIRHSCEKAIEELQESL